MYQLEYFELKKNKKTPLKMDNQLGTLIFSTVRHLGEGSFQD